MATYSIAEAKDRLPALVREAESGEPVTITRHGAPVASIVPTAHRPRQPKPTAEQREAFYARLAEMHARSPMLDISSVDLIRQMRDEGY